MAVTKFLARDLTIEVDTTPESTATWVAIGGLNSLTHAPSTARADTTGFDSNGRDEHIVASRGETWTLAGHVLEDVVAGTRNAGQDYVETLARVRGLTALNPFRITSPGGNKIEFDASAEVTLGSGGHNDAATWQCVLTVSGEPVYTGPMES